MELARIYAAAIRAHCLECSGGSLKEVKRCGVFRCALYPYRCAAAEAAAAPRDRGKGINGQMRFEDLPDVRDRMKEVSKR